MAVAPSNLLTLTSDIMSQAQARLRQLAIASTNLNTINALIAKREAIDAQDHSLSLARNSQLLKSSGFRI